jgi:hypothetical protein
MGEIRGKAEPRLFTPPLRELTPETSLGWEFEEFVTSLGLELLEWQRFWARHALEIRPDGSFRFGTIICLVSRQNGKTALLKLLALWLMTRQPGAFVLGAAQDLDTARQSWRGACDLAEDYDLGVETIWTGAGREKLVLANRSEYQIVSSNRSAGRGKTVDLLILDELREHRTWEGWASLTATTTARPNALTVAITNAGDDRSIVLNHQRDVALSGADERICILEWSAVESCDLDDVEAWAQANPGLGYIIDPDKIRSALATDTAAVFRTERLCTRVRQLYGAIDGDAWSALGDATGSLSGARGRIAACVDVSPDSRHVTLCAAAVLTDGRVRVETAGAWSSVQEAREALPELLSLVDPKVVGWFPSGPGAVLGVDLAGVRGARELKGAEIPQLCQAFAEQVASRRLVHGDDPLLTAHVVGASRLPSGDGWRFTRHGDGHIDACYAAAGAVFLARSSAAKSVGKVRLLVAP